MSTYVDPRTSITVIVGILIGIAILLPFFSSGEIKFKDRMNRQEKAEEKKARELLDNGHKMLVAKEYDSAKSTIREALKKLTKVLKKETQYHASGYLWLGRIAANEENYDKALELYIKAFKLADTFKSVPQIPKGLSKAVDSKTLERLKEGNNRLVEAKKRAWTRFYYNCYDAKADLYQEQGKFKKALEIRQEIVPFVEKNADQKSTLLTEALGELAGAYGDVGLSREERKTRQRIRDIKRTRLSRLKKMN